MMSGTSREVVGVFTDVAALEAAANALMSGGFDRSALSLIATEDVVRKEMGSRVVRVEQLEDHPNAPRIAYVTHDDLAIGRGALIGGLFYVGAVAGTAAVVMSGGAMLPAIVAAAAGGASGGGIGALLASWLTAETADKIGDELERGGLILWVRTHSPAEDNRAIAMMRDNGAYHAHAESADDPDGEPLIGWWAVRETPLHFVGLFETQIKAAAKAIDMGEGYNAHYGQPVVGKGFVREDAAV